MHIQYYILNVYGTETMYIADYDTRDTVRRLTGKITLRPSDKKALETLGHTFSEITHNEAKQYAKVNQ